MFKILKPLTVINDKGEQYFQATRYDQNDDQFSLIKFEENPKPRFIDMFDIVRLT